MTMKITNNWSTPIGKMQLNIPEDLKRKLIQIIVKDVTDFFVYDKNDPKAAFLKEYESMVNELIRYYLTNAYHITNAKDLNIEGNAFGNHQVHGGRSYPHYHHGFDGVLVHYLTAGEEYVLGEDDWPEPIQEKDKIHKDTSREVRQGYYGVDGAKARLHDKVHDLNKGETMEEKFPLQGSGRLILSDPRPSVNFPTDEKNLVIQPKSGMVLCHPSYLWHESNTFLGNGIRVAIVTNYRVLTQLIQPGQEGYINEK